MQLIGLMQRCRSGIVFECRATSASLATMIKQIQRMWMKWEAIKPKENMTNCLHRYCSIIMQDDVQNKDNIEDAFQILWHDSMHI